MATLTLDQQRYKLAKAHYDSVVIAERSRPCKFQGCDCCACAVNWHACDETCEFDGHPDDVENGYGECVSWKMDDCANPFDCGDTCECHRCDKDNEASRCDCYDNAPLCECDICTGDVLTEKDRTAVNGRGWAKTAIREHDPITPTERTWRKAVEHHAHDLTFDELPDRLRERLTDEYSRPYAVPKDTRVRVECRHYPDRGEIWEVMRTVEGKMKRPKYDQMFDGVTIGIAELADHGGAYVCAVFGNHYPPFAVKAKTTRRRGRKSNAATGERETRTARSEYVKTSVNTGEPMGTPVMWDCIADDTYMNRESGDVVRRVDTEPTGARPLGGYVWLNDAMPDVYFKDWMDATGRANGYPIKGNGLKVKRGFEDALRHALDVPKGGGNSTPIIDEAIKTAIDEFGSESTESASNGVKSGESAEKPTPSTSIAQRQEVETTSHTRDEARGRVSERLHVAMSENTVIVCGGRTFTDFYQLSSVLDARRESIGRVVTGGGRGADGLAMQWASENGIPVEVYEADWEKFKRAAGPIRNKRMIEESGADLVIAFAGGRGTYGICELAERHGLQVEMIAARASGMTQPTIKHQPPPPARPRIDTAEGSFSNIVEVEERARESGQDIGRAIADSVMAEIEAAAAKG